MEAKQKAEYLFKKYKDSSGNPSVEYELDDIVDLVLDVIEDICNEITDCDYTYWNDVKNEVRKLDK